MHDARAHGMRAHLGHGELDQAVVHQDAAAELDVAREAVVGDRDLAGDGALLRREHHLLTLVELQRLLEIADADPRTLQVAQDRDGTPHSRAIRRTVAIVPACSSWEPCEKLMRATLSPASMSERSTSGEEEAGPSVQTIFVRERAGAWAPADVRWVTDPLSENG